MQSESEPDQGSPATGDRGGAVYAITSAWPPARTMPAGTLSVFAPQLRGLNAQSALSIAALPIHDANGILLAALLEPGFRATDQRPDFAGLFLLDPYRRLDALFAAVRAAGITGIANLPSVDAFTGELRTALDHVGFHVEREAKALEEARAMGFRTLRLARSEEGGWAPADRTNQSAEGGPGLVIP